MAKVGSLIAAGEVRTSTFVSPVRKLTFRAGGKVEPDHSRYCNNFKAKESAVDDQDLLGAVVEGINSELHPNLNDVKDEGRGYGDDIVVR